MWLSWLSEICSLNPAQNLSIQKKHATEVRPAGVGNSRICNPTRNRFLTEVILNAFNKLSMQPLDPRARIVIAWI